jgi:ubiquitin-conjugating enzyme E2 G1
MASSGAALLLGKQFKLMQSKDSIEGISVGLVDSNVFEWEVMLMISDDCKFYGGELVERRIKVPMIDAVY